MSDRRCPQCSTNPLKEDTLGMSGFSKLSTKTVLNGNVNSQFTGQNAICLLNIIKCII